MCMYVLLYIYIYVYTHVCIYIYIYIYIYIHTHVRLETAMHRKLTIDVNLSMQQRIRSHPCTCKSMCLGVHTILVRLYMFMHTYAHTYVIDTITSVSHACIFGSLCSICPGVSSGTPVVFLAKNRGKHQVVILFRPYISMGWPACHTMWRYIIAE